MAKRESLTYLGAICIPVFLLLLVALIFPGSQQKIPADLALLLVLVVGFGLSFINCLLIVRTSYLLWIRDGSQSIFLYAACAVVLSAVVGTLVGQGFNAGGIWIFFVVPTCIQLPVFWYLNREASTDGADDEASLPDVVELKSTQDFSEQEIRLMSELEIFYNGEHFRVREHIFPCLLDAIAFAREQ